MNVRARTTSGLDAALTEYPLLAVVAAGREAEATITAALGRDGLSLARLTVLHVLHDPGTRAGLKDVATALGCAKSNASALVDRMKRDGLLDRTTDPGDRRGVALVVTPRGGDAYRAGLATIGRRQDAVLADLGADDRRVLLDLLTRLAP